jgi:hypothetical protein
VRSLFPTFRKASEKWGTQLFRIWRFKPAVIVTPAWRKILAFLSACGIVLSLFGYIYSFFGAPVDGLLQWGLLLAPVAGALIVPIRALEHRSSTVPTHSWRGFAHGMPRWFGPVANLLAIVAVAHLTWCFVQNGPGVPAIVNGEYVLDSRGRILKALTQSEYLALKAIELRVLATLVLSVYFVPMTYWCFQRNHQDATSNL